LKIAVDARNLVAESSGVARYLSNLLRFFHTISNKHEFFIYSHKPIDEIITNRNYYYQVLKGHPIIWKQFLLPIIQLKRQYDLLFVPTYSTPYFFPGKVVVTIHDLIFCRHPEWTDKKQALRFATIVRHSAKKADHIIAVSEATKKDILDLTDVPEDKVTVIYEGVDEIFRQLDQHGLDRIREKHQLRHPFILHVGAIHPRRNISRLIEAFAFLRREKNCQHELRLVGSISDKEASELQYKTQKLGIEDVVHCHGILSDQDLVGFYNLADVFIYPSLYEGFGLPVLESMACGTPVITSNRSSLPELAGDAAILVDPESVDEIAYAIHELISNRDLRKQLVECGTIRVQKFSWLKTTKQTLKLFEQVD